MRKNFIEWLIAYGWGSPAARDMRISEVIDQVAEYTGLNRKGVLLRYCMMNERLTPLGMRHYRQVSKG